MYNRLTKPLLSLLFLCHTAFSYSAGLLIPVGQSSSLEITDHQVDVTIEDSFAITQIEQVFANQGDLETEAIYSFPVPQDASVGEFTYWVDGKPIHAEVLERKQAREIYESEKESGRHTALVEKDSHKTFDISVSPVRPKQSVRIRLVYLQPVPVDMGIGRYVYPLQEGGVDTAAHSFWKQNSDVSNRYQFNININSAYPVDGLRFASHQNANVQQINTTQWSGSINQQTERTADTLETMQSIESNNGLTPGHEESSLNPKSIALKEVLNQDVVVYWRLKPGLPGTIDLKTYKEADKRQGVFSLIVTPGEELPKIERGSDWVFVLDISGSMSGKLSTLMDGVTQAIDKLGDQDRFKVIVFNDHSREITQGYTAATPENKDRLKQEIKSLHASSGTNLYAGLKKALTKTDEDRTSAVILVTDGVANVGITEKKKFFKLLDHKDIRLFTFVMGNSANRPLLEGLAKHSNGFSQSISTNDDVLGQLLWALEKVSHQALHDVEVAIKGVKVGALSPETIGTHYRGQQISIYGHYYGSGDAEVIITGKVSGQRREWRTTLTFPEQEISYPELERLWAYAKIKSLETQMEKIGESDDTKSAIKDIALNYGLVTDQTSMLVVEESLFEQMGIARTNQSRIEKEHHARQMRQQRSNLNERGTAHNSHQSNSTYQKPRPSLSTSGGGSFGLGMLSLLMTLLIYCRQIKRPE